MQLSPENMAGTEGWKEGQLYLTSRSQGGVGHGGGGGWGGWATVSNATLSLP